MRFPIPIFMALATSLFASDRRMPDGREFDVWEKPQQFSKTYYVDGAAASADDNGPGTRERPFRTINKAAQVLMPGERVVIAEGVYRECVRPARGGTGADKMISYEAAPGAKVSIRASAVLKDGWKPSTGWQMGNRRGTDSAENSMAKIWQIRLDPKLFAEDGYNPFAMVNVIEDRYWLNYGSIDMAPYFRRRGMVFVDGKPLEPVEGFGQLIADSTRSLNFFSEVSWSPLFTELGGAGGKLFVENNGLVLNVRLPNDDSPDRHVIEATVHEQAFVPAERYQGYMRVKGITFQHAGNGFPVPQRGLVSTNRGHHWIFDNNVVEWANSVGFDVGNENWGASRPEGMVGGHLIRNNVFRYCGIEGIGGTGSPQDVLVEGNLFEWIGWQNAANMSESAAMKMHGARNVLFRNNVVRHVRYANGVWLDIQNINNRLSGNIFADIPGRVNPHAIHVEGSNDANLIDNNIFVKVRGGVLIRDTNKLTIAHNLFLDCEDAGVTSTSGLRNQPRIISGHTNDGRDNRVYNNIFHNVGRAAIEFTNAYNQSDGNAFSRLTGGFLRVLRPEPQEWLDLAYWREQHGWDKNGTMAPMEAAFDIDKLELTLVPERALSAVPVFDGIDTDLFRKSVGGTRAPGPFIDLGTGYRKRSVDPRPKN
ncbi:MAG: right-handed parallel beta-helix repeat-containing protein [Candidatus Solibacter sp.]